MASAIALTAFMSPAAPASATRRRQKWIDEEFQPSTLTKDEQMKEMQWFINRQAFHQSGDQHRLRDHRHA
jgi:glycerol transport system substrate-binding protein